VLRLSFFDLDGAALGAEEAQLFGPSDAVKIWDLLALHTPKLGRVIVHCDAGYSRSPAVAAAIARVFLGDDAWYFRRYLPNRRVHRMLLEEAVSRGLL
jgi:protein-tyrosine phosphatase